MQDKLTPRQMRAWSLCALSVPAAMALPGSGWLWVLGGSVLACVLTVLSLIHILDVYKRQGQRRCHEFR